MAKEEKSEKSKSDHVREFLAANPKMGGKAVQEALAAKGVDVSIPLVNKVKYSKPSDGAATAVAGRRGRPAGANGNMSEDIRSYMESNPAATRPQIRDAMHASGHKVSTSLVNSVFLRVRAKADKPATAARRGRPARSASTVAPEAPAAPAALTANVGELSVTELISAKRIVEQFGGLDRVRQALSLLEQLT